MVENKKNDSMFNLSFGLMKFNKNTKKVDTEYISNNQEDGTDVAERIAADYQKRLARSAKDAFNKAKTKLEKDDINNLKIIFDTVKNGLKLIQKTLKKRGLSEAEIKAYQIGEFKMADFPANIQKINGFIGTVQLLEKSKNENISVPSGSDFKGSCDFYYDFLETAGQNISKILESLNIDNTKQNLKDKLFDVLKIFNNTRLK